MKLPDEKQLEQMSEEELPNEVVEVEDIIVFVVCLAGLGFLIYSFM